MKNPVALHRPFDSIAKQAGNVPSYWSCESISQYNDRTGNMGSGGTLV